MNLIKFDDVTSKIIELRNEKIILDSDIAQLYRVETRDINQAVKNTPDKFPQGYILELTEEELENLRWKFSTTKLGGCLSFNKSAISYILSLIPY